MAGRLGRETAGLVSMNGTERTLEHQQAIDAAYHADLEAVRARAAEAHAAIAERGMQLTEIATPVVVQQTIDAYGPPADEWSVEDLPLGGFPENSPTPTATAAQPVETDAFVTDDDGIPIWQD